MSETKALETFLTRFAAGAGTLFTWHLTEDGWLVAQVCEDHGLPPAQQDPYLCPLSAQATVEGGAVWYRHQAKWVAPALGLTHQEMWRVMDAADDVGTSRRAVRQLRARLLHICGIAEETQ